MSNNIVKKFYEYYGFEQLYGSLSVSLNPPSTAREIYLENLRTSYTHTPSLSEEHLATLKELSQEENNRLSSIETKISQVITQAGLIFVLSAFIAPIFGDTLNELDGSFKVILVIIFLLSFIAYLSSILMASRIFAVHNFIYKRTSATSVIDSPSRKEDLIADNVKNLISHIVHNREVNNVKADLLIFANRFFVLGFGLSGILSFMICCMLLYIDNPDHKKEELHLSAKEIDYRIQNIDNSISKINSKISSKKDSTDYNGIAIELDKVKKEFNALKMENNKYRSDLKKL